MTKKGSGANKWYVGEFAPLVWESLLGKKLTDDLIEQAHGCIEEERRKNARDSANRPQIPRQLSGSG